jgi:predicted HicB family RNase H-like nuclease
MAQKQATIGKDSEKFLIRLPTSLTEWIRKEALTSNMSINGWILEELENVKREATRQEI